MEHVSTVQVKRDVPRVAVVGGCGVGLTMAVERFPTPGETLIDGRFSHGPGGKGSNQAIAARRLGASVRLLSVVGPDTFGDQLRTLWTSERIAHEAVATGTRPTMVGFILVDGLGENRIVVAPGALDELTPARVADFIDSREEGEIMLVSLEIPAAAATAALRRAKAAGLTTILNPAPARMLPEEAYGAVDHLIPNRIEAATLSRSRLDASVDDLLDGLRRRFDGPIVLTLGADGVAVDVAGRRERIEAMSVQNVIDTTGAGDAFSGAYAVALAEGASVVEAARLGAMSGAFATTRAEVVPALPRRHELAAFAASEQPPSGRPP